MPYVDDKKKMELNTDIMQAKDVGDYNYLYCRVYLQEFIKEPRYATIARLRKASKAPVTMESVSAIEQQLSDLGVVEIDRVVARDLAFLEFYNRIGRQYEDFAIEKNGDLIEFQAAEEIIMEKLDDFYRSI